MAASRGTRRARAGTKPVSFEQIESEAVKLFSEKTYPVVGMRDISDTVGLLPGSLYAHIANKEELLLGIVRQGITNYIDALEPIAASALPAAERMRLIIRRYMAILHTTRDQTNVAVNQWTYLSDDNRQQIVELREGYEAIFARVLDDGIAAKEFPTIAHSRVAVLAIIGLLNSTMHWYSAHGTLDPDQIGDELADLALRGLCCPAPGAG